MDVLTHMLVGASVAQLPQQVKQIQSRVSLGWKNRALIGGLSAIFPDIDYLLFFWNPLEFVAYWHRAETHSLLLAPLWAWILSKLLMRLFDWQQSPILLFKICLAGILSHVLIDSLTTFGTQWFAPLSDYRVNWDLLFVIDVYFTLMALSTLILIIVLRNSTYRFYSFILPLCYLLLVFLFKQQAYNQLPSPENTDSKSSFARVLLPQPFSPLYWHVIEPTEQGINQAYLKLANDIIAVNVSELLGLDVYQNSYYLSPQLRWHKQSLTPKDNAMQRDVNLVWQHKNFTAFRDFAEYPVFYEYQKTSSKVCVWFSDLRYHWPNIIPSFRFGMCREKGHSWQLYRLKYFSDEQVKLIN
ncbi:MAG: metal-dependent hydrolase [Colwellia sp.]|nr:metal-dependent hydrolase [Colwellia sp.]